ncbi:Rho-binding antiterminator [uncultured Paraglaciecola sp.]|uniref:Rho-binding antiterminator n=1 Tax=uncultured Paraglaciecola sp. TaxID=1765024 RepID=UPI0030D7CFA4|tara:strand:+ start:6779 stop:7024 length:246 start_codon:yes stop_codon:yes gene_type:complete
MISCNEYDYIEIVCMFQYPIKITMKTGEIIEGTALDTQYNSGREECIKVKVAEVANQVILAKISKIEVCIENPHFKQVSFN